MKVVVAGSHGLLGSALTQLLTEQGWSVQRLVRRQARSRREISWDPSAGHLDSGDLAGVDAVVNLGGATLARFPWTQSYRRTIVASRTVPTALLATTLASMDSPPPVLLQASAVGYYGDRGQEELTESSPPGRGFLADLVRRWEAATAPAEAAGIRVAHLRTGAVALAPAGGSSGLILTAIKLGLGGPLGPGDNIWSWITVPDHAAAIAHLLTAEVAGPVNLTTPNPVSQRELITTLARALHRPAVLRVPAWALRLVLRDAADDLLLSGQRALPAALAGSGFSWQHPTIQDAAAWLSR
ncbi:TIGR01777 family oxidoreductase [Actinotalea sp. M2MS4P-6]|uniref:TIGR01777 family oxidoreductase n=1 Tax=Actinotalea sp. M2MS4P-6 TaxID=2983762 RepID=UPI0021E4272C|nr:TIGR01777 family oxidoreductase [Actinotalea sp. M2MS4P-6]MCV2396426.1 TIGR01777 family oxidoreductase [Actinotalea sp. M2MS4P-6]